MKDHHKALFIAAALIGFGVCSAQAAHKDVKHCADDYRKFYDAGMTPFPLMTQSAHWRA